MLASEVKINGRYVAKIGGSKGAKPTHIKIVAAHPQGGWLATNLETRRTIRVRSAKRIVCDLDVVEAQQAAYDRAREVVKDLMKKYGVKPA